MNPRFLVCFAIAAGSLHAQNTLKDSTIQRYWNSIRRNLEATAEVLPADKYSFKLTPAQFSAEGWLNHSTERNYLDCSILRGEPNPMPKAKTDLLTGKEEVTKNLKESFAYCESTFANLDDAKILSSPQMVASFLHTVVHNNEIYGNLVGYLRVSGIVPPSTAAAGDMMKKKKK